MILANFNMPHLSFQMIPMKLEEMLQYTKNLTQVPRLRNKKLARAIFQNLEKTRHLGPKHLNKTIWIRDMEWTFPRNTKSPTGWELLLYSLQLLCCRFKSFWNQCYRKLRIRWLSIYKRILRKLLRIFLIGYIDSLIHKWHYWQVSSCSYLVIL